MSLPQCRISPFFIYFATAAILLAVTLASPQISHATTQQLVFSPGRLRFGTVIVGQSKSQFVIVTNAGSSITSIKSMSVTGSEFTAVGPTLPLSLNVGESAVLNVTFAPTEAGGMGETLTLVDSSSNSTAQLLIAGVGVKTEPLTASPLSVSFGDVPVGATATRSVVFTNHNAKSGRLESVLRLGSGFSVSGPTMPLTLPSGQSVTVKITFAPKVAGEIAGSVFISGPSVDVPVTGTGTTSSGLTISPGTLNFGNVDVGSTATQGLSLTAAGGNVTVSSASSSNSQFTLPGTTFPLTISSGESVTLRVEFAPAKTGSDTAKLTFASNASSSPSATETVSGDGVQPQYSVSLSWNPSTSTVAGYNIYRGNTAGNYSKLNSSLNTSTNYADNTVVSGSTYYYAATSVTANGQESGYSVPLKVVIP